MCGGSSDLIMVGWGFNRPVSDSFSAGSDAIGAMTANSTRGRRHLSDDHVTSDPCSVL